MNKQSNMFKKIIITVAVLVVVVGLVGERFSQNNSTENSVGGNQKSINASLQSLVGKTAPEFTITDLQGKTYTNENLKGKKVVLFFNEGLACYPACWEQMKQLSSDSKLNTDDVVTLSVVVDSKDSWRSAIAKTSELGAIKVAFDQDSVASKAFGMTSAPSSMHGGVPGHSYVVIDGGGTVRFVLDDPQMGINNEKMYSELSKLQ
jgi:peroxiredoxin